MPSAHCSAALQSLSITGSCLRLPNVSTNPACCNLPDTLQTQHCRNNLGLVKR